MRVLNLPPNSSDVLSKKYENTINFISRGFAEYGDSTAVCFNGGKDATVLLDLVSKVVPQLPKQPKLKAFYLQTNDDFEEILQFINISEKYWNIDILRLNTPSLKDGLATLIKDYGIKAVFLGVRSNDMKIPMTEFEETTAGWPKAMRIMPILNWNYHDVWEYLELLQLPVCSLYTHGYTSIGTKSDTVPNPLLYDQKKHEYIHAKHLTDESNERCGRNQHSIYTK